MIVGIVIIVCCMNKRKNNLKEMERRVQLNTSNSSPADTDRSRELKTVKTPKNEPKEMNDIKEDKEVKEMEIELSER